MTSKRNVFRLTSIILTILVIYQVHVMVLSSFKISGLRSLGRSLGTSNRSTIERPEEANETKGDLTIHNNHAEYSTELESSTLSTVNNVGSYLANVRYRESLDSRSVPTTLYVGSYDSEKEMTHYLRHPSPSRFSKGLHVDVPDHKSSTLYDDSDAFGYEVTNYHRSPPTLRFSTALYDALDHEIAHHIQYTSSALYDDSDDSNQQIALHRQFPSISSTSLYDDPNNKITHRIQPPSSSSFSTVLYDVPDQKTAYHRQSTSPSTFSTGFDDGLEFSSDHGVGLQQNVNLAAKINSEHIDPTENIDKEEEVSTQLSIITEEKEICDQQYQDPSIKPCLIVFWTPFWHSWEAWNAVKKTHSRLRENRCQFWRCDFEWSEEGSMKRIEDADAVVFFSLDLFNRPLPPRKPQQLWIWLEMEAPPISQAATGAWSNAEENGHYFNMTMSYHHLNDVVITNSAFRPLNTESDCPLPEGYKFNKSTPVYQEYTDHLRKYDDFVKNYGLVYDQSIFSKFGQTRNNTHRDSSTNASEISSSGNLRKLAFSSEESVRENVYPNGLSLPSDSPPKLVNTEGFLPDEKYKSSLLDFSFTSEEVRWASRPKLAVWMASNCDTDSKREEVVSALQQHIDITTVGKCGKMRCGRNHLDRYCYRWLSGTHLFYLSFENALCDDYFSEKLWRPLEYGMVPVVYGAAGYEDILPEGSYIDVRSFPSIEALAKRLVYLANNPTAYLRYLQWRRFWEIKEPAPWTCNLCRALHDPDSPQNKRVYLDKWWNDTAVCYDPFV